MELSFRHFLTPTMLGFLALNAYVFWRICVLWVRRPVWRWVLGVDMLFFSLAHAHALRALFREIGWNWVARWSELWVGACVFLACWFLLAELAWFWARRFGQCGARVRGAVFALAALLALATSVYAHWRARQICVTRYVLTVEKEAGSFRHLRVAVLADLHLGKGPPSAALQTVVKTTNALRPDLIVLAGDIVEFSAKNLEECGYDVVLGGLSAPLGVYAVRGNHDYFDPDYTLLRRVLRRAGILLLEDAAVEISGDFYLAGRKDQAQPRRPLPELLRGVDSARPLLLIDHRPERIAESMAAGVDVQFSGHTHGGQFFPATLFTRFIYPVNSGVLREGQFWLVVSSGLWGGTPYRLGTRSEIVVVDIDFAPSGD